MSDLQIVLIGIGGVIIAAVLVFNWWQERRFHQQVENNFSNIKADALLDHPLHDEHSLDNSTLHDLTDDFNHDDFSINHELIEKTPATIKEPTIEAYDMPDSNMMHAEPVAEPTTEINQEATPEAPLEMSAKVETSQPSAELKPVNHEGIKAIFDDAFSKNVGAVNAQNDLNSPAATVNGAENGNAGQTLPAILHAQADLIAVLHLADEMTLDSIAESLKDDFDAYDKPVFVHVQTSDLRWLLLSEVSSRPEFADQKISKITCSLQLADRAGPVSRGVINRFQLAVESLGLDINAHVEWQNTGDAAADAAALDAFCIEVDKTMGFHLVHGANGAFTGTKLRGLAEAQGLELAADGSFKYYDEAAKKKMLPGSAPPAPSFVMFNRDHYPFSPEMLRSSVVKGVTFQLDIPHVSSCTEAYNHMVQVAKQMETGLNAQLVDDNNKPLGDIQIEKIRHQLKIIQATMLTRGITPGSDVAHRLFS